MSTRARNQSVRLTKTAIENAEPPASGQRILRDSELRGFGLRITAGGARSFIVEKRVEGRLRRITLGRYGELTPVQARKRAQQILGQIAMGVDPVAERRRQLMRHINLERAFADFRQARKGLKPKTLYDYDRVLRRAFPDWLQRPLNALTPAQVQERHRQLGETRGEAYANLAMRSLRTLYNFAIGQYDDGAGRPIVRQNPVDALSRNRAWYRIRRRRTVIKTHQLAAWYQAVESLRESEHPDSLGDTVADYLITLLLTGLRKSEAISLAWNYVDLADRSIAIPDTKNGEEHIFPIGDYLFRILQRRFHLLNSEWVFPGNTGRRPLVEIKRQVAHVVEASGVPFTLHDLRRTYTTVAEGLEISPYTIKRLVNHKMRNDVTAGYIVSDLERMRNPQQKIEDFFAENCGFQPITGTDEVSEGKCDV